MIVDVKKYLIFGAKQDMDRFFSLAQRGGFLEFINPLKRRSLDLPLQAKTFLSAIKIAKHYPTHLNELPPGPLEIEKVAEELVSMKGRQSALLEEERTLLAEIARIAVFGNFSRKELDQLEMDTNFVFQFFCMKSSIAEGISLPDELIHIGTEYDLDYFVAINREKTQYPKMIEMVIDKPLGELKQELFTLREEIAKLESDIRIFANALPSLQAGLAVYLDEYHLEKAKHSASLSLDQGLFTIEAWVPKTKVASLQALISSLNVDFVEIAIEEKDSIPTCLENRGTAKIGEDLLSIFDTPSHKDADPSLWVVCFFALFFAMIVSDAGYGLIFFLIIAFVKWKLPEIKGVGKRMLRLGMILSISAMVWGVLIASYFGVTIAPASVLQKGSVISYLVEKKADYLLLEKGDAYQELVREHPDLTNVKTGKELFSQKGETSFAVFEDLSDDVLMEFAFLVGILHISLSFGRYLRRNWAGLGWILFMIGGYLYFPSVVHATTMVAYLDLLEKPIAYFWGMRLMMSGIGIAFVLAFIQRRWHAFQELLHAVQVFTDVLSYLRLYALALGSMVMAHTFNDALGIDPGVVATVLIVLVGHSVNLALCLMGSVVHGLRLNFLEWFHYSFEGGGRPFHPLKLHQK